MDFSLNWLKRYVKTSMNEDEIAEIITSQGLTVDAVIKKDNDVIFDIDVTTNRPDAMNYLGLARELKASGKAEFIPFSYNLIENDSLKTDDFISVKVENTNLCKRYVARVVKNVKIAPSPRWLQDLLESVGIRAINNVVDISNFVLWETGQPLHTFDMRLIEGGEIIVRNAAKGEKITTLDGVERVLLESDIVIADKVKPVALAGIMGGENSEIQDDTTDVVIESAWFFPANVRKTAKRLAIHTDSSHRFERGADIGIMMKAANRAAALIAELAGGTVCSSPIDVYPDRFKNLEILLNTGNVKRIIGKEISVDFIVNTLNALDFETHKVSEEEVKCIVPTFRVDISREIDLIEEVVRMYGYNNVPSTLPVVNTAGRTVKRQEQLANSMESILIATGFNEAITYSFCSKADNLALFPDRDKMVVISNPLSEFLSVMRTSVTASLLKSVELNLKHGNKEVRLYEDGRNYIPKGIQATEKRHFAAVATKGAHSKNWNNVTQIYDYSLLRGIIEEYFERNFYIDNLEIKPVQKHLFKSRFSADIVYNGKTVGWFGEFSQDVLKHFDIDCDIVGFEICIDDLIEFEPKKLFFKPFSVFPPVLRDSAFLISKEYTFDQMVEFIKQKDIPYLKEVKLFDKYEGKGIPKGKVSIAINFVFQSDEKTLNSDEVSNLHKKVVEAFLKEFKAELR
jgi:phenylalanyl-tRNA synthetase beta chain